MKGVQILNRSYTKGVPFCQTGVFKGKEFHLGAETPLINICWVLPPPPGIASQVYGNNNSYRTDIQTTQGL